MTIVCGTDFSEHAVLAARAAGAIAMRLAVPLKLVHVMDAHVGIGHAGALQLVLGSQAHAGVQRARQPVLLVPPERGG